MIMTLGDRVRYQFPGVAPHAAQKLARGVLNGFPHSVQGGP